MTRHAWLWVSLVVVAVVVPGVARCQVLSGTIVDSETGKPVGGALIEVSPSERGSGYMRAEVGEDGAFRFEGMRKDAGYRITVTAGGYCDYEEWWRMPELQESAEVTLPLVRSAFLAGRMNVASTGEPLPGVEVSVWRTARYGRPGEERTFTGPDGTFLIEGLVPTSYDFEASVSGFITERYDGLRLEAGEPREIDIEMTVPARIVGRVRVDPAALVGMPPGEWPLGGVKVEAEGPSETTASTDGEGYFVLNDLRPGKYRLRYKRDGFHDAESPEVMDISEGKTVEGLEVVLKPDAASVMIVSKRDVFRPDESPEFQLRTFRVPEVAFSLYRLSPELAFAEGLEISRFEDPNVELPREPVLEWTHPTEIGGKEFSWIDRKLEIREKIDPGVYVLSANADEILARKAFFVTSLGIIAKRGEHRLLVYAGDLDTSEPVPGVEIRGKGLSDKEKERWKPEQILSLDGHMDRMGSTDGNGILDTVASDNRIALLGIRDGVHFASCGLLFQKNVEASRKKLLGFTDRPIYRPGDTVYFKVIARKETHDGLEFLSPESVSYRVRDPKGEKVFTGSIEIGEFGTGHGELLIPEETRLGRYSVSLDLARGGGGSFFAFEVQAYRKPSFEVEIENDRPDYVNGEGIVFTIRGKYYFGFPVRGGVVSYNVYETRLRDEDYWSSSEWGGYSTVFDSGKVLLDAEGNATVRLDAGYKFYNRRLTLEARVVDPSKREVRSGRSVKVGKGAYLIHLEPKRRFYDVGNDIEIEVTARSLSGAPVATEIGLVLEREVWNSLFSRYEMANRPAGAITVHTGEDGKAKAVFPTGTLNDGGRLRLSAGGKDERGNRITTSRYLWILGRESRSYSYQYKTLELETDRDRYRPGETAVVMIHAPEENRPLLLTVEGEDILDYRLLRSEGKTTRVEIPVRKEFAPNCFLSVTGHDGIHYQSRTVEIKVEREIPEVVLETEIKGYRQLRDEVPEFRPGDEVTVDLRSLDESGKPVAAELALAVVDEAIFAIRADTTPDLTSFFYSDRGNWVQTTYSFPMRHYGGAGKSKKDLEIRRNFKDTAWWAPEIRTGEDGRATVRFSLPDNLTTWRMTFRGVDAGPRFCVRRDEFLATKQLLAVLEGPRFFHGGDTVRIPALIHNRGEEPAAGVAVSLGADGGVTVEEPERTVDIGALSTQREAWALKVADRARAATLTVSAIGEQDADAMETVFPVRARGRKLRVFQAGTIGENEEEGELTLDLPEGADLAEIKVRLRFDASLVATTFGSIGYLRGFPFGCLEQTMNGFLPRCVMVRTLEGIPTGIRGATGEAGTNSVPWIFSPVAAKKASKEGIQKILERQHDSGGWSWWHGDYDDPMVTAFALEGLLLLQRGEFPVPRDPVNKGVDLLERMMTADRNPHFLAYGLHVLSLAEVERPEIAEIVRGRADAGDLSADGLAYLAMYHARSGESATAEIYLDRMLESVTETEGALIWRPEPDAQRPAWFGGWEDMTARGLMALSVVRPGDERCGRIVTGVLRARRGSRWSSTRSTSVVVLALAEYLRNHPESLAPVGEIRVQCNGRSLGTVEIPMVNGLPGGVSIPVPADLFHAGSNRFVVEKENGHSIYVSLEGEGTVTGSNVEHSVEGVGTRRELFVAERVVDSRGRAQILEKPLIGTEPVPAGSEIGCRTIVRSEREIPFVLLQVFLPSGFEVTELDYGQGWWKAYEYSERWDESLNFAFRNLPEGETRITSILRAELAGKFHVPPSTVWAMYEPEIEAWSSSTVLKVADDRD